MYASTRQVYGRARSLPVDEDCIPDPLDFNGIHKLAATHYHLALARLGELDTIVLRLSNVYGPRMALELPQQGFLGTFVRLALDGEPITLYGNGDSLRDPVYVDDVVEAFLLAGAAQTHRSLIYNVGGPEPLAIREIAEVFTVAAGLPAVMRVAFPENRKAIDIGSYYSNSDRIRRELGWSPRTRLRNGVDHTVSFYREHLNSYRHLPDVRLGVEALVAAKKLAAL